MVDYKEALQAVAFLIANNRADVLTKIKAQNPVISSRDFWQHKNRMTDEELADKLTSFMYENKSRWNDFKTTKIRYNPEAENYTTDENVFIQVKNLDINKVRTKDTEAGEGNKWWITAINLIKGKTDTTTTKVTKKVSVAAIIGIVSGLGALGTIFYFLFAKK